MSMSRGEINQKFQQIGLHRRLNLSSTALALKTGYGISRGSSCWVLPLFPSGGRVTVIVSKKVLLIIVSFSLLILYIGLIGNARWGDSSPPEISLEQPFEKVGPTTPLVLRIQDSETGLRDVSVRLIHNMETFVLADHSFPSEGWLSASGGKEHEFTFNIVPYADSALPRRQGEAQLMVTARDYSWRNWFEGNSQRLEKSYSPQFTPPRLELLSPPATIVQGGAGIVRYRVIPDVAIHGVKIGTAFFPGYPAPDKTGMFAFLAFPYNAPATTPIQLIADDGHGNTALMDVNFHVKPQFWRTRSITISEAFIRKTVPAILAQTPEWQSVGAERFSSG